MDIFSDQDNVITGLNSAMLDFPELDDFTVTGNTMPSSETTEANISYDWTSGEWDAPACPACGNSEYTRQREVKCMGSHGIVVESSHCVLQTKPADSETCDATLDCPNASYQCSAYVYETGVINDVEDSCTDGESLSTGEHCKVKCDFGYSETGDGTITCPVNASDNADPDVGIVCTPGCVSTDKWNIGIIKYTHLLE
eukprot:UN33507